MKRIHTIFVSLFITFITIVSNLFSAPIAWAQNDPVGLTNPSIGILGNDPKAACDGTTFQKYFVQIWRVLLVIGILSVLFHFVNGAIEWITAGGEKGKVEHARQKMTQAVVGMIILAGSFTILGALGQLFGFDVLRITFPRPEGFTC